MAGAGGDRHADAGHRVGKPLARLSPQGHKLAASPGKRIGGARSKGGNQETEMDPLVVVLMIVVVLATWAGLAVWLWRSEHRRQRNTRDRQP
jgi:hypothetical protein